MTVVAVFFWMTVPASGQTPATPPGSASAETAPRDEAPGSVATARLALVDRGLSPLGRRWISVDEARLIAQVDGLDRLHRQLHDAEKVVTERIAENDLLRRRLAELRELIAARERLRAATPDAAARQQLTTELLALTAQEAVLRGLPLEPEAFAERPDVRQAVLEWIRARNALAGVALDFPAALYRIESRSRELSADAAVARALAALGPQAALGSGRKWTTHQRRLEEARRAALTPWLPLYRQSGRWRTSIFLGDSRSTLCTLDEGDGPLLVPESVLRAAGVTVAPHASRTYTADDGRRLTVQVVRLPLVRVGSHSASAVEAWVLPPEGEDLGTVVPVSVLQGSRVRLDPLRLRLTLEPTEPRP